MIKKPLKTAIFFDYGGTLDAPGLAWKEHFLPIYKEYGIDPDLETFARAFYASDDSLVAENPVHMNLTEIVYEQVSRVLKNLGYFNESITEKIASHFLRDCFENIKKNLPVLERLRERYRLGIISNNYGNLEAICKETGLKDLMDVLVDSNLVGKIKPHPEIFQEGLMAIGCRAEEAVMVGDNLRRDIEGAKKVGMDAILITSSPFIPENATSLPMAVIRDIRELDNIFMEGD